MKRILLSIMLLVLACQGAVADDVKWIFTPEQEARIRAIEERVAVLEVKPVREVKSVLPAFAVTSYADLHARVSSGERVVAAIGVAGPAGSVIVDSIPGYPPGVYESR